jgi:hypothetical protein
MNGGTTGRLGFRHHAAEKCTAYRTERRRNPKTGKTYAWIVKSTALGNHYNFYCEDRDFGPHILDWGWGHVTIKMSGHPPFGAQIILNGHALCRPPGPEEGDQAYKRRELLYGYL